MIYSFFSRNLIVYPTFLESGKYYTIFFFESRLYLISSLHFNGKIILSCPSGIQLHFLSKNLGFLLFLFYLIARVQFSVFKFSIFPVKHFPISIQISHHLNLLKCFLDFRRLKVVLQFRYLYLVLVTSPWANCYRPLLSCCESDS